MALIEYYAHAVILPVVLTLGCINQCINISTLLRLPSNGFVYLKASAISDIFSIIFAIPFCIRLSGYTFHRNYYIMWYHAHLELTIANTFLALSAMCIVAMTIDRYLSVCHPIHFFNNVDSSRRAHRVVKCLVVAAFIIHIPTTIQKELKKNNQTEEYELVRNPTEQLVIFKTYIISRELLTKIGPMILIVILNIMMVDALRKMHKKNCPNRRSSQIRDRPKTERFRLSILLTVTSITFVVCNLPATLLHLFVDKTEKDSISWQIFRAGANISETSAYLFNFYLYALCSSEYREALFTLLGCRKIRSNSSTPNKKLSTRHNETSFLPLSAVGAKRSLPI